LILTNTLKEHFVLVRWSSLIVESEICLNYKICRKSKIVKSTTHNRRIIEILQQALNLAIKNKSPA